MAGIRYLYITEDLKVIKVPIPKGSAFKAVPGHKNQSVLCVELLYETENRVPVTIWRIIFNRIELDENGQYDLTTDEVSKNMRNVMLFSNQTPESLSEGDDPLPIPSSMTIPTRAQRKALLEYIKNKMPTLHSEAAYMVQQAVAIAEEQNKRYRKLILDAAKIRKLNRE